MIDLRIERVGVQKMSWLGNFAGLATPRTVVLAGDYTDLFVDNTIPAGTAVAADFTPWTGAAGQVFAGFTVNALPVDKVTGAHGRAVALMDTGRVVVAKLPHAGFVAPTADANASTIIFA